MRLPDRGGLRLSLKPRLADGLDGVDEYMSRYPYSCLEQQVSRAVALRDDALWAGVAGRMSRLSRSRRPAQVLRQRRPARQRYPDRLRARHRPAGRPRAARRAAAAHCWMRSRGLRAGAAPARLAACRRRILTVRKLAAIEALSRYGAATPEMLQSITLEPNLWPTSAVLDWLGILQRVEAIPDRDAAPAPGAADPAQPPQLPGHHHGLLHRAQRCPVVADGLARRERRARGARPAGRSPAGRRTCRAWCAGPSGGSSKGRWSTTTANAWGVLALDAFSARFEAQGVDGRTTATLAGRVGQPSTGRSPRSCRAGRRRRAGAAAGFRLAAAAGPADS